MTIKTETRWPVGKVAVGGGFTLHEDARVTVTDEPDVAYDLVLDVELSDGRYVVEEMVVRRKVGGDDVVTRLVQRLPIARLLARAMWRTVGRVKPNPGGEGHVVSPVAAGGDELVRVAGIYRVAYACGVRPTKAVAEELGIPTSTATKKVMRARERGLLDPTTPGKAGG